VVAFSKELSIGFAGIVDLEHRESPPSRWAVKPKLSVIICAHNPRNDYLSRTLEGLRTQTLDKSVWELLLVDNASKESLAHRFDLGWHPQARVVIETDLGLTPARLRGIAESVGDVLVFVDDDNVLATDYLDRASIIAEQWPQLGAWGGQQHPEFEAPPLPALGPFLQELTIRSFDRDVWAKLPHFHEALPWGAGMCVRRIVASQWQAGVQQSSTRKSLGRTGTSLASAEDLDLAMTACDLGLGTGLFHSLALTHLIPAGRLTAEYLLRLVEAKEFSHMMLLATRGYTLRKPTLLGRLLRWYQRMRAKDRLTARVAAARQRGHDRAIDVLSDLAQGDSIAATVPQTAEANRPAPESAASSKVSGQ
jgi:glycosyltransferase involved in cell wall biosynthesis